MYHLYIQMRRIILILFVCTHCVAEVVEEELEMVKLTPKINVEEIDETGTEIPLEKISAFLKNYVILDDKKEFEKFPNIKGQFSNRLLAHVGDFIYAQDLPKTDVFFNAYVLGDEYVHPDTGEFLGVEMKSQGVLKVENFSKVSTLRVIKAVMPLDSRMKLIPNQGIELPSRFENKRSNIQKEGYILSSKGNLRTVGIFDTVVLSLGKRDGLKVGDNLDIVNVAYAGIGDFKSPDSYAGKMLVFQTYEKLSLAVITRTFSSIKVMDKVKIIF